MQNKRETLAQEKGGLNTEYAVLKERIHEVERIRKYAEEVQRAIVAPSKNRAIKWKYSQTGSLGSVNPQTSQVIRSVLRIANCGII